MLFIIHFNVDDPIMIYDFREKEIYSFYTIFQYFSTFITCKHTLCGDDTKSKFWLLLTLSYAC